MMTVSVSTPMQRQAVVTAYFQSKQLLLFAFVYYVNILLWFFVMSLSKLRPAHDVISFMMYLLSSHRQSSVGYDSAHNSTLRTIH